MRHAATTAASRSSHHGKQASRHRQSAFDQRSRKRLRTEWRLIWAVPRRAMLGLETAVVPGARRRPVQAAPAAALQPPRQVRILTVREERLVEHLAGRVRHVLERPSGGRAPPRPRRRTPTRGAASRSARARPEPRSRWRPDAVTTIPAESTVGLAASSAPCARSRRPVAAPTRSRPGGRREERFDVVGREAAVGVEGEHPSARWCGGSPRWRRRRSRGSRASRRQLRGEAADNILDASARDPSLEALSTTTMRSGGAVCAASAVIVDRSVRAWLWSHDERVDAAHRRPPPTGRARRRRRRSRRA